MITTVPRIDLVAGVIGLMCAYCGLPAIYKRKYNEFEIYLCEGAYDSIVHACSQSCTAQHGYAYRTIRPEDLIL